MAVDRKSEQGSKEEIAKGMAEAGKDHVGKAGGGAALKGRRGHGAIRQGQPGHVRGGLRDCARRKGPPRRRQEPLALTFEVSLVRGSELGGGRSLGNRGRSALCGAGG